MVKRLIYLYRCGKNPDDIVHLFGSSDESFLPDDDHTGGAYIDLVSEDGEAEAKSANHKPSRQSNQHRDQREDSHSSDDDVSVDEVLEQAQTTRMAQRRKQENQQARSGKAEKRRGGSENEQFLRGLKHVSSKIAPVVSHDRRMHQQATQRTTKAALRTVAQHRVDALVSTAVPVGFKDRNYFSEPHLFHSKPSIRSAALASAGLSKGTPTATHPQYKRYADLGTGMATMEIADAFLQGDIGREILSSTESDYRSFPDPDPLNPACAQRTAAVLLGLPTYAGGDARFAPNAAYHNNNHSTYPVHGSNSANLRDHGYKSMSETSAGVGTGVRSAGTGAGDLHVSNYATSQADFHLRHLAQQSQRHQQDKSVSENDFGHRNMQDKRAEQKLNEGAKRLYEAPGWRSAQGGWVADFGPPHTHALYTGPEVNYASLVQDRAAVNHRMRAEKAAQGDFVASFSTQGRHLEENNNSVRQDTATVTSTYRQQSHHHQGGMHEQASSGAEQHVQRALDSASRHNAQLQAQYRAGADEIDQMIKASHQDLARSVTSAADVNSSFASSAAAREYRQDNREASDQATSKQVKTATNTIKSSFWDDSLGAEDEEGLYSIDTAVAGAGAGSLREIAQKARAMMNATTTANATSAAPGAGSTTTNVGQGAGIAGKMMSEANPFQDTDSSSDGFDYSHGAYAFGGELGDTSDDSAVDLNGSMSLSAAAKFA